MQRGCSIKTQPDNSGSVFLSFILPLLISEKLSEVYRALSHNTKMSINFLFASFLMKRANLWIMSPSDLPLRLPPSFLRLLSVCPLFDPLGLPPPGMRMRVKLDVRMHKKHLVICVQPFQGLMSNDVFVPPCSLFFCLFLNRWRWCAGGLTVALDDW